MNCFAFVAIFAFLAAAHASIAPVAEVLQGPSSRTTLVGPEGSVISSVSPGGKVITEQLPGAVAYSAPVVAAAPVVSSYAAPVISSYAAAPVVSSYSAPVVSAYAAPVAAYSAYAAPASVVSSYAAPIAAGVVAERTVVAGPSGSISTGKTIGAPVVAAYSAPVVAAYSAHAW